MKKFLIPLILCAVFCSINTQVYATELDGREIIKKIKNETWGGSGKWDFAEAIYNVKDDSSFQNALKYYIESNCSVQNNKIYCR